MLQPCSIANGGCLLWVPIPTEAFIHINLQLLLVRHGLYYCALATCPFQITSEPPKRLAVFHSWVRHVSCALVNSKRDIASSRFLEIIQLSDY